MKKNQSQSKLRINRSNTRSIWHLSNVLNWFSERRAIEQNLAEVANANMQLNIAKENTNSDPKIQSELYSVFA
ncbi:MAG: hypothetical protein COA86_12990 [Kangiella sp.]|nr:MAG: hypothetical protein COA86_12990 [Kangiella sp.]